MGATYYSFAQFKPILEVGTDGIKTILIPFDRLKVDIDPCLFAFSFFAKPVLESP
jgi:hypothetical protein